MTADLDSLRLRLVLLANRDGIMPAGAYCALCTTAPVLPGAFLAAIAYSDRRAGFVCPRCARDVDPVVAELSAALNAIDALVDGLDDPQHRSGLAHALSLLLARLTAPHAEGDPECRTPSAVATTPDQSTQYPSERRSTP